jgi:hypothetical protein
VNLMLGCQPSVFADDSPTPSLGRLPVLTAFAEEREPSASGSRGVPVAATPNAYYTSLIEQMTKLQTSQQQTEAKLAELLRGSRGSIQSPAESNGAPQPTSGAGKLAGSADSTASGGVISAERNNAVPPATGAALSSGATPVNKSSVMRPKEFDGKQSINSFLAHFEVCAKFNKWGDDDKQMWLQWSLKDRA